MAAPSIFGLLTLLCVGAPSVTTCKIVSIEHETLMTQRECADALKVVSETATEHGGAVVLHRCASLAELFPGQSVKLGPNPPNADSPPTGGDQDTPDEQGRLHL